MRKWVVENRGLIGIVGLFVLLLGLAFLWTNTHAQGPQANIGLGLFTIGTALIAPLALNGIEYREKRVEFRIVDLKQALELFPPLYNELKQKEEVLHTPLVLKLNTTKRQKRDEDKNPVFDEKGKPVMEEINHRLRITANGKEVGWVMVQNGKYKVVEARIGVVQAAKQNRYYMQTPDVDAALNIVRKNGKAQ